MKKSVRPITAEELPEPFRTYWFSKERLNRNYNFFMIEGELYIQDNEYEPTFLLHHWTLDSCAGIGCFLLQQRISERRDLPYVGVDGTYLFEVIPSDSYETSVRWEDGRMEVVHSG